MCSNYSHHSKFSNEERWEGLCDRLGEREPSFWPLVTLASSQLHFWNLNWLILNLRDLQWLKLNETIPNPIQRPKLHGDSEVLAIGPCTFTIATFNRVICKALQRGRKPWVWSFFEKTFYQELVSSSCIGAYR